MAYDNLKDNTNAEKWDLSAAESFFDKALKLSNDETKNFDFVGEIARELKSYKEVFTYLSDKFPELKIKHKILLSNCEANCFYNGKKQNIVPSLAIMNLKSNHGWTDRAEVKEIKQESIDLSKLSIEEIEQLANIQSKMNGKST